MQEKKTAKNLRIRKVCIVGVIPSFAFQRAKYCALELHRKLPQRFPVPEIVGLLELDWSEKLQEWRQMLGREFWCLRRPVAVFFDNRFVGSDLELIKLTTISNILIDNIPRKDMSCLKQIFRKDYISYLKKSKRIYCFLDICVDDVYAGTLTFRLYSDLLPRTCENFKTLCLGNRGPPLSYKGSRIHRIVKKGWLQGGDIQYKTGGGGFSIFCDPLEDECYGISHDRRGVLSMANAGRHKNGSQFFITLQPSRWMDTHFVAFGHLIEGVKVLNTLENLETFYESPISKVEIKNCGKLDLGDVEDVDVLYKEEQLPPKKRPKIEKISDQIVRMITEALMKALQIKVRAPDILADGDVVSKMNLQLYFQGFYSLPHAVLEKTAEYLRNLRRELFRLMKPSATEIVESLMYDLQMAIFTRMTTLDDVRRTVGRDLYDKMISRINLTMEGCKKSYVKRLIDQIVKTAENMVELITKKVLMMKRQSKNLKNFQDRMHDWLRSFVMQETFEGDNYFIAERPYHPPKQEEKPKEGKVCCEEEKQRKRREMRAKVKAKFTPEDICCLGSQLHLQASEINLTEFFSTCRYGFKGKKPGKERMPLLDLIEISRFKLRWIRKQEQRRKTPEVLCMEKKIRRWMDEVRYTSETSWLKDSVFPRDCRVLDHVEEIMYGAMTAGLLEMYFIMDQYLKICGGKRKKLITRTIYQEDSQTLLERELAALEQAALRDQKARGRVKLPEEEEIEGEGEGGVCGVDYKKIPCPCGHPCCDCPFKPFEKPIDSEEKEEGDGNEYEDGGEGGERGREKSDKEKTEEEEKGEQEPETEPVEEPSQSPEKPCESDETLVDLNLVMAQKLITTAEKIDINSFKWLKPYIIEQGCDLKSDFAGRVHNWIEGEQFNSKDLISKHSLATRASLLSLSFSLAELVREENNIKTEIKDFVYDLWDLYFEEMFKEAALQSQTMEEKGDEGEEKGEKGFKEGKEKGKRRDQEKGIKSEGDKDTGEDKDKDKDKDRDKDKGAEKEKGKEIDECEELKEIYKDFDLERYCKQVEKENEKSSSSSEEVKEEKFQEGQIEPAESHRGSTPRRVTIPSMSTPRQSQTSPEKSKSLTSATERKTSARHSEVSRPSVADENATHRVSIAPQVEAPSRQSSQRPSEQSKVTRTPAHSITSRSIAQDIQTPRMSAADQIPFPQEMPGEDAESRTEPLPVVTGPQAVQESQYQGEESSTVASPAPVKKKKSPIVIQEIVEIPSSEEVRIMPPYVPPFWVNFLTEMTKQALAAFSRVSRLPRRLYLRSDSAIAFEDKMKEWFEFNAFNPQPTRGREIMDFIALHHKNLIDLEDTARSFMKKKVYSDLINRCTRFDSADDVAGELVSDAIMLTQKNLNTEGDDETVELFVSGLVSSAAAAKGKSQSSLEEEEEEEDTYSVETDEPYSSQV